MRWWPVLVLAACKGDGSDGDDGGLTDEPFVPSCNDPGPDEPVVLRSEPTSWEFQGFPVFSYVPPEPVGLIWYFHGGAKADEVTGPEQTAVLWNQMVDAGFAVVATQRTLPGEGDSWDMREPSKSANVDLRRILDLWDELVDTTAIESDTPIVFTGFSDGSGMAASMGDWAEDLGMPAIAVVAHNGAYGLAPDVPARFVVGALDNADILAGIDGKIAAIREKDVEVEKVLYEERPITPESFLREDTLTLADGQALFDDLVEKGMIDADGVRLVAADRAEQAIGAWATTTEAKGGGYADQRLHVMWAMHRYSGIEAKAECEFVLAQLP